MNMIDRFMLLIKHIDDKKKSPFPSPVLKWKIKHRKYEILNEIKKESYTANDLRYMSWIINYGKMKWPDIDMYPDTVRIVEYGKGLCVYQFEISPELNFSISISQGKNDMDIVEWNGSRKTWSTATITNPIMTEVIYTVCYDSIWYILDRLIKGD